MENALETAWDFLEQTGQIEDPDAGECCRAVRLGPYRRQGTTNRSSA